ncbi:MAG: UDP-3-O-(3-hydroxymyristoyl)glucosamine N-acyltransferase [Gammaproteobacteria bacterium]
MKISAAQLAAQLKGELRGDGNVEIASVAPASAAGVGAVTFAETAKHVEQALASKASVIVTFDKADSQASELKGKTLIFVKNPRVAFARTLALFHPPPKFEAGVHPSAIVAKSAQLAADAHVGAYAVVKDDVRVGARSAIDAGAVVGEGVVIGPDCVIYPRVTIYPRVVLGNRVIIHAGAVIGSDGFGYVTEAGQHLKIPQVGNVVIEDDVEIGANTTIDRATLGSTVVKRGTKIDNLVQIAHNNTIGEHCLIVAQTGLAGSVTLGKYVMLGGQVGIADHNTIGDQVMIGAQGGVIRDISAKSVVWGTPTQPNREWLRQLAALRRLPEIIKVLTEKGILGSPTKKG